MSFAADIKDFTSGFATGWKLMTPTAAEVRERENQQLAKERDEFRRTAIGSNVRRSGGGPDEDTSVSPRSDTSTMADVSGTTTDPAAEDLQPHEKALLNAISGPESAGRYNIRYTPKGGATFDETGEHPAIYEPTKEGKRSSAAGRYQFVKSTWDKIAGKDVPFTRENQDRMALKLARQDYQTRTGRNLDADLKANGLTPSIMRQLAPTWAGFGGAGGRSKALNIYQASLNRYSGDTSTKAGLPRYTGPDEDRSEVVQTDEEGTPVARVARASAVPLPPIRPASFAAPAADPALGRRSALELTPGVNDDELMYPQYAAKGGLVVPENASDTIDDTSEDADMKYLYGADSGDYASGRSSGYGARELVDRGTIPKMISDGMDYLTQKFGLTSGAIPAESPQAQRGVQAFAAGAGTPSHEEVDQIMQTVDPNGTLPKEQRHVVGWGNLYHYFSDRGDAQGAARASAAMLMYSKNVSRQAGTIAMAALEKGDFKRASDAVAAAYDYLPDGKALKVKNVGPGGIEYETVDVDGKRVEKGKIKREELADIAKGMVDGTLWFQSVNAASAPVDKAAQRKAGESKVIDQFEENMPEDTRGVEDLPAAQRKLWSQLPSPYRREQEKKWRDLKKQDKTEGEAAAEAEFSESPELRDQFLSSMSDKDRAAYGRMSNAGKNRAIAMGVRKLKEDKAENEALAEADYLKGDTESDFMASRTDAQKEAYNRMGDKGKARALTDFRDDRKQHFAEQKFDTRLQVNAENRDRAEALKLFGMAQKYGMWEKTREQIMTENERRAADRLMQEEGRNTRQNKSIEQQNKVQQNIDRRILEKRTATLDGAGAKLTAPEAREQRRLGAIDQNEEARLVKLDEDMGSGVVPDEQAGAGEVAAQRLQRGRQFEQRSAPIIAGAGYSRLKKDEMQAEGEETKSKIAGRFGELFTKETSATPQQRELLGRIAYDVFRADPKHDERSAANAVHEGITGDFEPRVFPGGAVQLSRGSTPVRMSEESMAILLTQRELRKRGGFAATPQTAVGESFSSPAEQRRRAAQDEPRRAAREQRSALALQNEATEREQLRAVLGADWRPDMTLAQMREAASDLRREQAWRRAGRALTSRNPWER